MSRGPQFVIELNSLFHKGYIAHLYFSAIYIYAQISFLQNITQIHKNYISINLYERFLSAKYQMQIEQFTEVTTNGNSLLKLREGPNGSKLPDVKQF